MIKKCIVILALLATLAGCSSSSPYDLGYDHGFDRAYKKPPLLLGRGDYLRGYNDGYKDGYYFDLGCEDKSSGITPRHPNNGMYMEGYREGF